MSGGKCLQLSLNVLNLFNEERHQPYITYNDANGVLFDEKSFYANGSTSNSSSRTRASSRTRCS